MPVDGRILVTTHRFKIACTAMSVVTNILPSTGIALPFFSYGGTALAVNLGEMGVILSVSRQIHGARKQEEDL